MVSAAAISHNERFNPRREMYNPPSIPPNSRHATPIVPYNIPTVSVLNSKPPPKICPSRTCVARVSTKKGWHNFTKKPSLKRYSSINATASSTPGFVKKVTNASFSSLQTSLLSTLDS